MKRRLTLILSVLMLMGIGWQSDLLPRLIALENRVTSLEIVLLTPTSETFPDSTPSPTPQPNLVLAINPNTANVNIRTIPGGAIIGKIPPQAQVLLCLLIPPQNMNNLSWMRVSSGGFVAIDFLEVTDQQSIGVCQ